MKSGTPSPYDRYSSLAMRSLFSDERRYRLWRELWIELAICQRRLGIKISARQIASLKRYRAAIDFDRVAEIESETRHDVMAHIRAFAEQAKAAAPIIHLGATSNCITDNADLILMRDGTAMLISKLAVLIETLEKLAHRTRNEPMIGYTHFQPAQPVTFGKRVSLWLQDFMEDFKQLTDLYGSMKFRSIRGATGTQDSFLKLFNGNAKKVLQLERDFARAFGFKETFGVTGQTYPRKFDDTLIGAIAGLATSAGKMAHDIRLLQHLDEISEGFSATQVGSSAMPFKQNPMKAERLNSIARLLATLPISMGWTAASQWLERTLDDSAIRRIVIPQAFFLADAVLELVRDLAGSITLHPAVAEARLKSMAAIYSTERWMMAAVGKGGNRQAIHEAIRRASRVARDRMRRGEPVDFVSLLKRSPAFQGIELLPVPPKEAIGLCAVQVSRFCGRVRRERVALLRKVRLKSRPDRFNRPKV